MDDSSSERTNNSITGEGIRRDLERSLGLSAGDNLEVHSSLRSIGWVEGGAATLIQSLLEAIDAPATGTLTMPCFNSPHDSIDLSMQPSITGSVPEAFRLWPGAVRSFHPTHSTIAFGRRAQWIVEGHPSASALGVDSPFDRLSRIGGSVLLIGCRFNTCSLVHVAEAMADLPFLDIPYPGYDKTIYATHTDGTTRVFPPVEVPGESIGFHKVETVLEERGALRHGTVGQAPAMIARGSDVIEAALSLLRDDPTAFLVDTEHSEVNRRRLVQFHARKTAR